MKDTPNTDPKPEIPTTAKKPAITITSINDWYNGHQVCQSEEEVWVRKDDKELVRIKIDDLLQRRKLLKKLIPTQSNPEF